MRSSSLWRQTRRREHFRYIWETIDKGLYALTLIKTKNDESIDLDITKQQIQEPLEECLKFLDSLLDAVNAPIEGSPYQIQLIDELELTEEQLQTTYNQLKTAQEKIKIKIPENETGPKTLRTIEKYAQNQATK
jgi:hypothetical protein